MGGVFLNYRRGPHIETVRMLYERLARHFGDEQVFLDTSSMPPGGRYPTMLRQRVLDCDVLLVVIDLNWLTVRDEHGVRRLDGTGDWVRQEIELALAAGKIVIPLVLDDAAMPLANVLPASIVDLAHRQSHLIRDARQYADTTALIGELERHVAPTWAPIASAEPEPRRPDGRLWVVTAVLSAALLAGWPALAWGDPPASDSRPPAAFTAAGLSLVLMCAPLIAVVVYGPFAGRVNVWERELQAAPLRRYFTTMMPVAASFVALGTVGVLAATRLGGVVAPAVVLLMLIFGGSAGAAFLRAERNDREQWANWPQRLPDAVPLPVVRRAAARLEGRLGEWSRPLSREQREKAEWTLADLDRAVAVVLAQASRSRLRWLVEDCPWVCSGYVLWMSTNTGLATASVVPRAEAGTAPWLMYALPVIALLLSAVLSAATMERVHRYRRRQRRTVANEVAEHLGALRGRLEELSSPARWETLSESPESPGPRVTQ